MLAGDYVIAAQDGGVFTIKHVLYKEQIKHLKTRGLWPFAEEDTKTAAVYDPLAGIDDESGDSEEDAGKDDAEVEE